MTFLTNSWELKYLAFIRPFSKPYIFANLVNQVYYILRPRKLLVNKTDLQALYLSGTYCHNIGKDPLALLRLDNQLFMLDISIKFVVQPAMSRDTVSLDCHFQNNKIITALKKKHYDQRFIILIFSKIFVMIIFDKNLTFRICFNRPNQFVILICPYLVRLVVLTAIR